MSRSSAGLLSLGACALVLLVAPPRAEALESWECSVMRRHTLRLARPMLTPRGRVVLALDLEQGQRSGLCARLTKADYRCVLDARSYAAARACVTGGALVDLDVPTGFDAGAELDLSQPPLPAPAVLATLAAAKTYAVVIRDTSESSAASAKTLARSLGAVLGASGLKEARRGKAADVTVEVSVTGTAVALPYEDLGGGHPREQYTATVIVGELTLVLADGTRVVRPFDLEQVPVLNLELGGRRDRPRDAPWPLAFHHVDGPVAELLPVLLASRGPAAHFHVLRNPRVFEGGLSTHVETELVITRMPAAHVPEVRAALRDKSPEVRAAAARVLGDVGDAGDLPALDKLARDRDGSVVSAAAAARKAIAARVAGP